jgi:ADP-heptose:LPS heptosyltransferase
VLNATRPKQSIGFQPSFDEYVDVERDVHMFDKIFALVQRISPHLDLQDFCAPPLFSPPAVKVAKRLKDQCIGKGTKLLFVHPETKPDKMWINSDYNYVLGKFLKERPQYQAVVCTQQRFELDCHPRIHSIRPHLELALALVGLADSFLGVDSCFLHAADLYGVPGIAMFGPTNPKIWGYRLTKPARNIYADGQILNVNKEEVLQALLDVAP